LITDLYFGKLKPRPCHSEERSDEESVGGGPALPRILHSAQNDVWLVFFNLPVQK
jgi:hypothetical protein